MSTLYWHAVTKAQAVLALLRGKPGVARILWRWMANRPTPADIAKAKRALARPEVLVELRRIYGNILPPDAPAGLQVTVSRETEFRPKAKGD